MKADIRSKFLDAVQTTPANIHDSQVVEPLLDKSDAGQPLYADSGYCGWEQRRLSLSTVCSLKCVKRAVAIRNKPRSRRYGIRKSPKNVAALNTSSALWKDR